MNYMNNSIHVVVIQNCIALISRVPVFLHHSPYVPLKPS